MFIDFIAEKIRVFASSNCRDKKYLNVRSALKQRLEKTGFITVYLFEHDTASSATAEEDYMDALEDSHIILFLIDNEDKNGNIPGPVMKEHLRATSLDKKIIYIFYNSKKNKITNLQNELMKTDGKGRHYEVVSKIEEFINRAFKSVISDIIKTYKSYCKGRLLRNNEQDPNSEKSFEIAVSQDQFDFSEIDKKYFKIFSKSKGLLSNIIFEKKEKVKSSDNYTDEFCFNLLRHLLGKIPFSELKVEELKEEFIKQKRSDYVIKRWEAIQTFYSDDLDKTITLLSKSFKESESSDCPKWIQDDILVDKRFIETIILNNDNKFGIPESQLKLNQRTSFLAFPVLDRISRDIYGDLLEEIFELSVKDPSSIRMSNTINELFTKIEKYTFTAVYYGSLVHLLLVRKILMEISFHFALYYSDTRLKSLCLQMSILNGEVKYIKKVFEYFISDLNVCSFDRVKRYYILADMLPTESERDKVKLTTLQYIGYYLKDKDYLEYENEAFEIANSWIKDNKRIVALGYPIINSMHQNIKRINLNKVVGFSIKIFQKNLRRFYYDTIKLLYSLNWENVEKNLIKKLVKIIDNFIKDKESKNNLYKIKDLIIIMRKTCEKYTKHWDILLKREWSNFYNDLYTLEVIELSENTITNYILKLINQLKERNKKQGINGRYFGYGIDIYATITNILDDKNAKIDLSAIVKPVSNILLEVLYNEKQTAGEKANCVKLLMSLQSNCQAHKIDYEWGLLSDKIIKNQTKIFLVKESDLLSTCSLSVLRLYIFLYKVVNDYKQEQEALSLFTRFSNVDNLESFHFIECIFNYIKFYNAINSRKIPYILFVLQVTLNKSYDEYYLTRRYAVKCMGFLSNTDFKSTVITRLSEIMEDPDYRVRVSVLAQMDVIRKNDEQFFYHILQKAKADNNFIISSWIKNNYNN